MLQLCGLPDLSENHGLYLQNNIVGNRQWIAQDSSGSHCIKNSSAGNDLKLHGSNLWDEMVQ